MLHRIIYVSAAQALLAPDELATLLAESRRRNAAIGVTGLMLYHDGSFFQVLEGPPTAVQTLFATICADTRHKRIITMWSGPVVTRAFPDWRMGFAAIEDLPPAIQQSVASLHRASCAGKDRVEDRTVALLVDRFLASFRDLPSHLRTTA